MRSLARNLHRGHLTIHSRRRTLDSPKAGVATGVFCVTVTRDSDEEPGGAKPTYHPSTAVTTSLY